MSTSAQNFDALVTRYLDGQLSPEEHTTFTESLRGHPDRQRTLIDLTLLRRTLVEATRTTAPPEIKIPTATAPGKSPTPKRTTPLKPGDAPVPGGSSPQSAIDNRQSAIRVSLYATAAILLIAAYSAVVYFHNAAPKPDAPDPQSQPPVATLIESTGSPVVYEDNIAHEGGEYARGSYSIESGSAQFLLRSRVTVDLRGKTQLRMYNPSNVYLARGEAAFKVPKGVEGFTVHLPDESKIVDLGTAFRVEVDDAGQPKLRVTEGSVEWTPAPGGEIAKPVLVEAGQAAHFVNGRIATYSIPTVQGPIVVHDGSLISLSDRTTSAFADARNILTVASASEHPTDGKYDNNNPDDLIDGEIDNNYNADKTVSPEADQWLTDQSNPTLTFTFDTAVDVSGMKIDWAWQDRTDGVYAILINGSTAIGVITVSGNTEIANPAMAPTHLLFASVQTGVTSIALVITGQDDNTPALAEVTFFGSPQSQTRDHSKQHDPTQPQTQNRQRVGDKP